MARNNRSNDDKPKNRRSRKVAKESPVRKEQQSHCAPQRRLDITPKNENQRFYLKSIRRHDLTFGLGAAGTGKTLLAISEAIDNLLAGNVEKIILTRPVVEAGENLGFLPGGIKEKLDPYMRPVYDALHSIMPKAYIDNLIKDGTIEVAPLAYMRGRNLDKAFIVLDEAQNTSLTQMKLFLTRLGRGSKMVICGDPNQIDLPPSVESGLSWATNKLGCLPEIGIVRFDSSDIIRHPLVAKMVKEFTHICMAVVHKDETKINSILPQIQPKLTWAQNLLRFSPLNKRASNG